MAVGTLVWQRELRCLLRRNLTVDVVAHAWWGIIVDVVGVVLWSIPQEDLEERMERGDISPCCAGEDDAPSCLMTDKVL